MVSKIRGLEDVAGAPVLAYQWAEVPGSTLRRAVAQTRQYIGTEMKARGIVVLAATQRALVLVSAGQGLMGMKAMDRLGAIPREDLATFALAPGKGLYQEVQVGTRDGQQWTFNVQKPRAKAMAEVIQAMGFPA